MGKHLAPGAENSSPVPVPEITNVPKTAGKRATSFKRGKVNDQCQVQEVDDRCQVRESKRSGPSAGR